MDLSRKQSIFREAARLFQVRGYSSTSMRELAQAVGLEPSSLYSHISSKEEILQEICFSTARRFLEAMDRMETSESGPLDKVQGLLSIHIRLLVEDPTVVTVFNDEWRHLSEPALGEFLAQRKAYEKRFLNILEAGMQSGCIRKGDPVLLLNTLLYAVRGAVHGYRSGRQLSLDETEAQVLAILLKGVGTA